jgi:FKBP-type peptidyl-prolyl cis-trans isomerase SlyD
MTISQYKVVTLTYELRLDNAEGEFVEKTDERQPLVFLYGAGQMIPAFEKNLLGLSVGDNFAFGIEAAKAYGETDPEAIVAIPRSVFAEMEETLEVGMEIPMRNDNEQVLNGVVHQLTDTEVVMDFNHPMAGKNLYFTGSIEALRDAEKEEIEHGHVHGQGGHQH